MAGELDKGSASKDDNPDTNNSLPLDRMQRGSSSGCSRDHLSKALQERRREHGPTPFFALSFVDVPLLLVCLTRLLLGAVLGQYNGVTFCFLVSNRIHYFSLHIALCVGVFAISPSQAAATSPYHQTPGNNVQIFTRPSACCRQRWCTTQRVVPGWGQHT